MKYLLILSLFLTACGTQETQQEAPTTVNVTNETTYVCPKTEDELEAQKTCEYLKECSKLKLKLIKVSDSYGCYLKKHHRYIKITECL